MPQKGEALKRTLVIAVCVLAGFVLGLVIVSLRQPTVVSAHDPGTRFGYLQITGSVVMPTGGIGQGFIDMRDGTEWHYDYSKCIRVGRFTLEQIEQ